MKKEIEPLFDYQEFTTDEAHASFRIPWFQRETDDRVKKLCDLYCSSEQYTSEPILLVREKDSSLTLIDGSHRFSAFLLASEQVEGLLIPANIKLYSSMNSSMKQLFLDSNKRKAISYAHRCLISESIVKLLKIGLPIIEKKTNSQNICSSDLIKMVLVYTGRRDIYLLKNAGDDTIAEFSEIKNSTKISSICIQLATRYAKQCLLSKSNTKQALLLYISFVESRGFVLTDANLFQLSINFDSYGNSQMRQRMDESFYSSIIDSSTPDSRRSKLLEILDLK